MIGLVVDNPKRDLDGLVLLSRQLAARGISSALVPMYQQGIEIPLLDVNAVVLNYARPNNRALIESYKAMGLSVFVLDTEGGVLSSAGLDSPDNWARRFQESGARAIRRRLFFLGRGSGAGIPARPRAPG